MTPDEEFAERMRQTIKKLEDDPEALHRALDEMLCKQLEWDYPETVSVYRAAGKWYA